MIFCQDTVEYVKKFGKYGFLFTIAWYNSDTKSVIGVNGDSGGVIGMPKGVARPYEERIADKQRKRSIYVQKIQTCKKAISKLEKEEQRFRALLNR